MVELAVGEVVKSSEVPELDADGNRTELGKRNKPTQAKM